MVITIVKQLKTRTDSQGKQVKHDTCYLYIDCYGQVDCKDLCLKILTLLESHNE